MIRFFVGIFSFFEQWAAEIFRQPVLIFTLILAPFLLLFAFGAGIELGGTRPRTVIVEGPGVQQSLRPLLDRVDQHVFIAGIVESLPIARRALERGEVDAVIVVPENPQIFIEESRQVPLEILISEVDPVQRSYARAYLRDQVAALNQRTIQEVVGAAQFGAVDIPALTAQARSYVDLLEGARGEVEGARAQLRDLRAAIDPLAQQVDQIDQTARSFSGFVPALGRTAEQTGRLRQNVQDLRDAIDRMDERLGSVGGDGGLPTPEDIAGLRRSLDEIEQLGGPLLALPPEVISAPFTFEIEDVTPIEPSMTAFYAPGVLALLLQHLAVTLGALTLSRMRILRVVDMLRVAPIRATEVLVGNYLSYAVLSAIVAAALVGLLIGILEVPVLGHWWLVVGTVALLILSSLGIGFVVSLISKDAQQATQVAMLILLGSIFFSGFAFSLDRISDPVSFISYLFPARYGIQTLQDVMLRGILRHPEDLIILGSATVALFVVAAFLMRRELKPS